ncbi:peptidase MA family metallohydrolase [Anaeromicrobium sediminis]|nr:peptidase MA family metallohydrolase [Anaeromicrobium sediminis]
MRKKLKLLVSVFVLLVIFFNFNFIKAKVYPIINEIGEIIMLKKVDTFKTMETEKLIIKYDTDENTAKLVAETLEDKYDSVAKDFNYISDEKKIIIIYEDGEKLNENTNLRKGNPPMGVYVYNTVSVLSPNNWINDDDNLETIFKEEGPMVHEFTHLIVDEIGRGNFPIWFTEGISLYMEYDKNGYEWGSNLDMEDETIYNVKNLTENFYELDEFKAYRKSFEYVKGFVDEYGFDKLNEILIELGEGTSFDEAHKKVIGKDVEEIYVY